LPEACTKSLDQAVADLTKRLGPDWQNSVCLNNRGQSGDVNDPRNRNFYELWARGKYFAIFFSRPKREPVAENTITLTPQ
jgi:penicillin G amidase